MPENGIKINLIRYLKSKEIEMADQKDKIYECIMKLDNHNIQFVSYQPQGSQYVSIGRRIKIAGPLQALEIIKFGKKITPFLIETMRGEERDWVANVLLYSIFGREEVWQLSFYSHKQNDWRRDVKKDDIAYWTDRLNEE